jgi:hypothetical protein
VEALKELIKGAGKQPEIVVGDAGMIEVASHPDAQAVITGIVGCAGLAPTCAAISRGKDICLANKETLIAGELLRARLGKAESADWIIREDTTAWPIWETWEGGGGGRTRSWGRTIEQSKVLPAWGGGGGARHGYLKC